MCWSAKPDQTLRERECWQGQRGDYLDWPYIWHLFQKHGLKPTSSSPLSSPRSQPPQLPDEHSEQIQLPTNVQLPTSAGGIGQLISDYPLALPLVAALVLIPLAFSQASGGSSVQGVSAARALAVLKDEDPVVFLDIRSAADFKSQGSPDLSSIKKAAIRLPFTKVGHAAAP